MTTKTNAKTAAPKTSAAKTFTLADLARDLKINPKIARAKARRHSKDLAKHRVGTDGWNFSLKAKPAVSQLLTGAAA